MHYMIVTHIPVLLVYRKMKDVDWIGGYSA